ncbi:MAG: penicillin-binding transpeptidase domain-containing protein, partial [Gemmatimonadota bacterium]
MFAPLLASPLVALSLGAAQPIAARPIAAQHGAVHYGAAQLGAATPGSTPTVGRLQAIRSVVDSAACFVLYEVGVGQRRREPSSACSMRLSPASTFKVPHALAALDAGVVSGPDEVIRFDGTGSWPELSRKDHTLATAIRYSVVWYFQRVATRLGMQREQAYLTRLAYG